MKVLYKPKGKAGEYAELAVNLYSGCTHGCLYCYAPRVLHRTAEDFHSNVTVRKNVLSQLEKDAAKMSKTDDAGKPVHLCFTCDPYPVGLEGNVTRDAIEILKSYGFGIQILTKAGMRATEDFDLLDKNDSFGTTLTFHSLALAKHWEPGAASPSDRMRSLKGAYLKRIKTWVSLEPVIVSDQTLKIIEMTHRYVDLYKVGKLNYQDPPFEISWRDFAIDVTTLLNQLGKSYLIKEDLKKFLEVPVA